MKKVLMLLANGFESYEAAAFIDVIGWNYCDGDKSTRLFTCGITKKVKTSFDQSVEVDYLVDEINVDQFDALAIPGGFEEYDFYRDAYSEKFCKLINEFNNSHKLIASICVAALPLGKSGILRGKNATTYRGKRQKQLSGYGVSVVDKAIVIEGNIITSWNPATAIDVALHLLEKLTDKNNAKHIRDIMGFSRQKKFE
jgi:4-methyl-5(b-hydroxyethyl)-thiazole monophosphate biosynthesis